MPRDRIEPRWLDRAEAAAYVSMSEAAFSRRVTLGRLPKPNHAAGEQSRRRFQFADLDRVPGRAAARCKAS